MESEKQSNAVHLLYLLMILKSIFKEKPEKWGLRGDPFLWDDLERYFSNTKFPKNEAEFEKTFLSAFQELTGESLQLQIA